MHGVPGMDGIKTGYTKASGFNVVSSGAYGQQACGCRRVRRRRPQPRATRICAWSSTAPCRRPRRRRRASPTSCLVARRKAPSRVETGISAMPGEPEPASQTVAAAEAEDAAEAPPGALEDRHQERAQRPRAAIPKLKASPQPARAQKAPKQDQIAAVIARGQRRTGDAGRHHDDHRGPARRSRSPASGSRTG